MLLTVGLNNFQGQSSHARDLCSGSPRTEPSCSKVEKLIIPWNCVHRPICAVNQSTLGVPTNFSDCISDMSVPIVFP